MTGIAGQAALDRAIGIFARPEPCVRPSPEDFICGGAQHFMPRVPLQQLEPAAVTRSQAPLAGGHAPIHGSARVVQLHRKRKQQVRCIDRRLVAGLEQITGAGLGRSVELSARLLDVWICGHSADRNAGGRRMKNKGGPRGR